MGKGGLEEGQRMNWKVGNKGCRLEFGGHFGHLAGEVRGFRFCLGLAESGPGVLGVVRISLFCVV